MFRRDHSLTAALCVSVVAHAGMVFILVGELLDAPHPPPAALSRTLESKNDPASPIFLPHNPPPPTDLLFGDPNGTGDAANSAPGDRPIVGRDAGQVQAFLSRDPVGAGEVGAEPTMNVLPQGVAGDPAEPLEKSTPADAKPPIAVVPPVGGDVSDVIGIRGTETAPLVRRKVPVQPDDSKTAIAEQAPRLNEMVARSAGGDAPQTSRTPPADPAAMSDSESDPFAHGSNSIEFRDGRVDVRFGRKVKTVRPRLSLAAKFDLMGMEYPRMVVRLHVEANGDVRDVEIIKSTGSRAADQEVKVALYQWWVEPPKDKRGTALADVAEFPIIWR
jgi:TonB family protein